MKFSEDELQIESFNEYTEIRNKYLNHSKTTFEELLKTLKAKENETTPIAGPQRFTPTYAEELTSYHVLKNLGDVYSYEATISAIPSTVHDASKKAFDLYNSSKMPKDQLAATTIIPPSILYAKANLHISLAQRTTGSAAMSHLDKASKILEELASEKWNPWNPSLVSESLGRIYSIKAILLSQNTNESETFFLKARSEYQKSLRHEPATKNTHDDHSMISYRRSGGSSGRIPLPSCGLVPDDLFVLITRGYHELFHARFAMSKKSTFYALTLLKQSNVMFNMACGFDPRGTDPVTGVASVNAEIALLYPGTTAGNLGFESAEAQFAAVTDIRGEYGCVSENAMRSYLNYSVFLLFSAVTLERCAETRNERLADALTAALIAMNMGSGYELAPVFVAAYAAFLLDMVDLCTALVMRYNNIIKCESESRLFSPEIFASAERDSVDMNEFLWRFAI